MNSLTYHLSRVQESGNLQSVHKRSGRHTLTDLQICLVYNTVRKKIIKCFKKENLIQQ